MHPFVGGRLLAVPGGSGSGKRRNNRGPVLPEPWRRGSPKLAAPFKKLGGTGLVEKVGKLSSEFLQLPARWWEGKEIQGEGRGENLSGGPNPQHSATGLWKSHRPQVLSRAMVSARLPGAVPAAPTSSTKVAASKYPRTGETVCTPQANHSRNQSTAASGQAGQSDEFICWPITC